MGKHANYDMLKKEKQKNHDKWKRETKSLSVYHTTKHIDD